METSLLHRSWAWLVVALVVAVAAFGVRVATGSSPDGASASSDPTTPTAARSAGEAPPVSDREDAPDVRLALRDGGTVALADFAGQPVVVNFWASWCPPCVAEMGDALEPAHRRFGDRVTILGVTLQDEPAAAQRIVDRTGVTYQLAVDPDGSAFAAFEGVGMPTTVFVDAQGRIVDRHTGIITADQLRAQIDRLVGS